MTKADLVSIIARQTDQEKPDVATTIDAFFDAVKASIAQGETLHLRGFGKFCQKHHPRRHARNITKNTQIVVEAYDAPVFKPSKEFIQQVKKGGEA